MFSKFLAAVRGAPFCIVVIHPSHLLSYRLVLHGEEGETIDCLPFMIGGAATTSSHRGSIEHSAKKGAEVRHNRVRRCIGHMGHDHQFRGDGCALGSLGV